MSALNLTRKAISIFIRNASVLAQLTLPAFGVYLFASIIFASLGHSSTNPIYYAGSLPRMGGAEPFSGLVLLFRALVIAFIAVLTHRYILLEDKSYARALSQPVYGNYLLRALFVGLALIAVVVILFGSVRLAASLIARNNTGFTVLVGAASLSAYLALFVFAARWSVGLPAAALGAHIDLRSSWDLTRGLTLPILITVGATAIGKLALSFLLHLTPYGMFRSIAQALVDWPIMIFGAVVLTTLYGRCVEGRSLEA